MKKATAVVVVSTAVILVLLAGQLYISSHDLGLSNPYWNGLSHYSNEVRPIYDMNKLSSVGPGGVLLILGPQANFTVEDCSAIASFMERGGEVVVMDDYGSGNSLLQGINAPIRLCQVPLCQDGDFYRRPSFPVIKDIVRSGIMHNVSSLVFDHPVSLNLTGNASAIASTSQLGWLDYNDDDLIDYNESTGSYPLAAQAGYGNGELIVIGDPDLLINGMLDQGDNQQLAVNLLQSGTIYADVSGGQTMPPLAQAYYTVKYSLPAQVLCMLAIFLLAYIYYRRNEIMHIFYKAEERHEEPTDIKAAIIEQMKKTPLKKEQIEELKKKL